MKGGGRRGAKDVVAAFRARQRTGLRLLVHVLTTCAGLPGEGRRTASGAAAKTSVPVRHALAAPRYGRCRRTAPTRRGGEKQTERAPHELFRRTGRRARWTRFVERACAPGDQ
ncbi:hypothetical protein MTO96_003682 [Rhipicephalus appendiculatus]